MPDYLRRIEAQAVAAWAEVRDALHAYGAPSAIPWDMRVAAAALTGGPVDPHPDLVNAAGERLAGSLQGTIDRPRILFEAYDPPERQRFTIAHELGHFFLHAGGANPGTVYGRCTQRRVDPPEALDNSMETGDVSDEELEADAFAGALLMPESDLRADLAHFGRSIAFLAQRYAVSEAAMRRRLATLGRLSP